MRTKSNAGKFPTGRSGNPKGRPPGSRNRTTLACEELLEGEAKRITRKVIDRALEGDPGALKLCMDRLMPVRRERPISVELPELATTDSITAKLGLIFDAVTAGRLLPYEGEKLANLLSAQLKAKEGEELEPRIAMLEKQQLPKEPAK